MTYTIAELIDDRNRALYDEIASKMPIVLDKSDDDGWGALTKEGKGFIYYAPSRYPVSCFTHELLHLSFDLRGMGRPGFTVRSTPAKQQEVYDQIKQQLSFIYNQLIHHKIYKEFISTGFPREEFLAEADKQEANNCAKRDLPKLKAFKKKNKLEIPCSVFIYPYFFLRSPDDATAESRRLLKDLRNISDQSFYKVNAIIRELQDDENPDMRKYLGKIFLLCDQPDVGFGYSENEIIWASECAKGL